MDQSDCTNLDRFNEKADLFFDYGQAHSAAELYQFYTQLQLRLGAPLAAFSPKENNTHTHKNRSYFGSRFFAVAAHAWPGRSFAVAALAAQFSLE